MFLALLPNTGQNPATLLTILIVGSVLVVAGIAAMIGVRVSRRKNENAKTFKPEAPAAEKPAAETTVDEKSEPAPKKAAAKKPATKKPASEEK